MRASSHGTSSPFIQIFSVGVIGMRLLLRAASATASPISGGGRVSVAPSRPATTEAQADAIGRCRVLAEEVEHHGGRQDRGDRVGLPLTGDVGGRAVDGLEHRRAGAGGLRLPQAASPMPPDTAPPRSVRMSPKRLSVTITS